MTSIEERRFADVLRVVEGKAPGALMLEMILERVFHAAALDAMFERSAEKQYTKDLMFSSIVDLMLFVVLDKKNSVHRGYLTMRDEIGVSCKALYDKLGRMETGVSEALVATTAERCADIIDSLPNSSLASPLGDIPLLIVDGNHLAHTHKRLKALRDVDAGPLPGFSLAFLDPQRQLLRSIIAEPDAYAGERTLFPKVLEHIRKGECIVADRHFCTGELLLNLQEHRSFFVIRQHSNLPTSIVTEPKLIYEDEEGQYFEQIVLLSDDRGRTIKLRRATLKLKKSTRKGDVEIHVVSNLTIEQCSTQMLLSIYRKRWSIEGVFQQLETLVQSEVETLGFPKAALFSFSVAVTAFNVLSTLRAALRSAHGTEQIEGQVSHFHVAFEARNPWQGLRMFLLAAGWCNWHRVTMEAFVTTLARYAALFKLGTVRKAKSSPDKPSTEKTRFSGKTHVSTHRVLAESKAKRRSS